jgi:hypothetical protein
MVIPASNSSPPSLEFPLFLSRPLLAIRGHRLPIVRVNIIVLRNALPPTDVDEVRHKVGLALFFLVVKSFIDVQASLTISIIPGQRDVVQVKFVLYISQLLGNFLCLF